MSYKNPSIKEISSIIDSTDPMIKYFCKSYLELAKYAYYRKYGVKPTLDNALELYNLYVSEWKDYYIDKPLRIKLNKIKGTPLWRFTCKFKLNVHSTMCNFIVDTLSTVSFRDDNTTYKSQSTADILKAFNYEFAESFIIDMKLEQQYYAYILSNKNNLKKYYKPRYIDYSHLAYNGVANDF